MGPDVGAVVGDEDRHVAHRCGCRARGSAPSARPLRARIELDELAGLRISSRQIARACSRAAGSRRRELVAPTCSTGAGRATPSSAMNSAKSSSHAACAGRTPRRPRARRPAPCSRSARTALRSSGRFQSITRRSRRASAGNSGASAQVAGVAGAALDQRVEADQQRIAGEGREALVGRVAVAGGAERQHLPEALAGVVQEVGEAMRFGAQLADAVGPGQRRRMQQDAAGSGKSHDGVRLFLRWMERVPWMPVPQARAPAIPSRV